MAQKSVARLRTKSVYLENIGAMARGLRPSLQEAFYPHFDIKKIISQIPPENRCKKGQRGKKFGISLDRAFEKSLEGIVPSHPYYPMFKAFLDKQEWKPVAVQVPVGVDSLRLGTSVDLVCLDKLDRVILIELKTGYDSYLNLSCGKMMEPYQDFDCSPKYINLLQLFYTMWMFTNSQHEFSDHEFGGAYLLWGHDNNCIDMHRMPKEWWTTLPDATPKLALNKSHSKKRRTRHSQYHRAKRRRIA